MISQYRNKYNLFKGKLFSLFAIWILLTSLCIGFLAHTAYMVVNYVQKVGLKNIIEEVWEGTQEIK